MKTQNSTSMCPAIRAGKVWDVPSATATRLPGHGAGRPAKQQQSIKACRWGTGSTAAYLCGCLKVHIVNAHSSAADHL